MEHLKNLACGCVMTLSSLLTIAPVFSQHVSPGPGWEHIGTRRNTWFWLRVLPKPGGSNARGAYEMQMTYPSGKSMNVYKTVVNCDSWEQYDFSGNDSGRWKPIMPGSNGESHAEKACS